MIITDIERITAKLREELKNLPYDCGVTVFVELSDGRLARVRLTTAKFEEPQPT